MSHRESCLRNSAGSLIGGWQVKFAHRMATLLPSLVDGRFGIVAASAGGRFCATALLAGMEIAALFSAEPATASR